MNDNSLFHGPIINYCRHIGVLKKTNIRQKIKDIKLYKGQDTDKLIVIITNKYTGINFNYYQEIITTKKNTVEVNHFVSIIFFCDL